MQSKVIINWVLQLNLSFSLFIYNITGQINYTNLGKLAFSFLNKKSQVYKYYNILYRSFPFTNSCPMPPPTINNHSNPKLDQWIIQDQLILSALNSSLFDTILAHVLNCSTSCDVWTTLYNLFQLKPMLTLCKPIFN